MHEQKTYKNYENNVKAIKQAVKNMRTKYKITDIHIYYTISKTSNSIYVKLRSDLDGFNITRSKRWSDHETTNKIRKGKPINQKITQEEVEKWIYGMIKSIRRERLRRLLENEKPKRKHKI